MNDTAIQQNAPQLIDQAQASEQESNRTATAEVKTAEDAIAYTNATEGGSVEQDPTHVATAKLQSASDRATTQAQQVGGDVTRTQAAFEGAAVKLDVQYPTRFTETPETGGTVYLDDTSTGGLRFQPVDNPVKVDDKTTSDAARDAVDKALGGLEKPEDYEDSTKASEKNLGTIAEAAKQLADAAAKMKDPQAANKLIRELLPKIEAATQDNYNSLTGGAAEFNNKALLEQLARLGTIAKNNGDTDLVGKIMGQAKDNPALAGVANGTLKLDPNAALEGLPFLIELNKTQPGVLDKTIESIQSDTKALTEAYVKHTEGLNWCISNLGQNATPEALKKAIDGYVNAQTEEWRDTYNELQGQLKTRGEQLLTAAQQLRTQLPEGEARAAVESLFSSKHVQFAVEAALSENPAKAADASVIETRNWLAGGGEGSKAVASSLGASYVQHALSTASNAAEVQAKLKELEQQPGLAASLGLSQSDFTTVTDVLGKAVLAGDVTNQGLEALGKVPKGNVVGKLLGSVGAALSAKGLVDDVGNGEWLGAALNGVSAVAGVLAVTGIGTIPAGITSAAAALGRLGLDQYQTSQEANKNETKYGEAFLRGLGYSEAAAKQLINNTGSGESAVPLLEKYTRDLGLSREDSLKFINDLATRGDGLFGLKQLVEGNLHGVLGTGDLSSVDTNSGSYKVAEAWIKERIDTWNKAGRP